MFIVCLFSVWLLINVWNRDTTAARNIRILGVQHILDETRPQTFQRNTQPQAEPKIEFRRRIKRNEGAEPTEIDIKMPQSNLQSEDGLLDAEIDATLDYGNTLPIENGVDDAFTFDEIP